VKGLTNVLKKIPTLLIGMIIGALLFSAVSAFAAGQIKLIVDGTEIYSDVPPQIIDGRTMVPARFLAEALGAKVSWDESRNAVIVTSQSQNNGSQIPTDLVTGTDFSVLAPYHEGGDAPVYTTMQEGAVITMAGESYTSGIKLGSAVYIWNSSGTNTYSWNLDGRYNTLTAVLGLDDSSNGDDQYVVFKGDGKVIKEFNLRAGCMPQNISIPVSGVNQLTIETGQRTFSTTAAQQRVNLANAMLVP
jgi:membrane-bound inhibitor of C-type lysozyme